MENWQSFICIFNSMKKYFNKTTTAILLLLGAVLIGVFLLWPMLQEFLRVEHELEQYNIALVGREKYVSNLVILARQLDAREEAIRKIEAAIPDNTSIPWPARLDVMDSAYWISGLARILATTTSNILAISSALPVTFRCCATAFSAASSSQATRSHTNPRRFSR